MSVPMDPKDCSPPGPFVHGVSQARILDGLLFPSAGDLPDPEIKAGSPPLSADSSLTEQPGKPHATHISPSLQMSKLRVGEMK